MTPKHQGTPKLGLIVFLIFSLPVLAAAAVEANPKPKKSLSAFPILMYDSNIGVGYGGKAKFVNYFARKESLDFIAFNSSKGERWYVFTFSAPDFEIRQGKAYPFSFDLKAEYDKFLKYSFYGTGANSRKKDETVFVYAKKELRLTFGRGFSPRFVTEASYVLRSHSYDKIPEGKPFTEMLKKQGDQFSPFVSIAFRYDTSDSQIHPTKGIRLLFQNDWAAKFVGNKDAEYYRGTLEMRKYLLLLGQRDVVAVRVLAQGVSGSRIPLFELASLGGGTDMNAMRGYPVNRFLDKGKFLVNAEYRFPIWKKLGGNVFLEGGCVWPSLKKIDLGASVADLGWGLRYYLENFVVRFDMGFSREGAGIYFNFGHIF